MKRKAEAEDLDVFLEDWHEECYEKLKSSTGNACLCNPDGDEIFRKLPGQHHETDPKLDFDNFYKEFDIDDHYEAEFTNIFGLHKKNKIPLLQEMVDAAIFYLKSWRKQVGTSNKIRMLSKAEAKIDESILCFNFLEMQHGLDLARSEGGRAKSERARPIRDKFLELMKTKSPKGGWGKAPITAICRSVHPDLQKLFPDSKQNYGIDLVNSDLARTVGSWRNNLDTFKQEFDAIRKNSDRRS